MNNKWETWRLTYSRISRIAWLHSPTSKTLGRTRSTLVGPRRRWLAEAPSIASWRQVIWSSPFRPQSWGVRTPTIRRVRSREVSQCSTRSRLWLLHQEMNCILYKMARGIMRRTTCKAVFRLHRMSLRQHISNKNKKANNLQGWPIRTSRARWLRWWTLSSRLSEACMM